MKLRQIVPIIAIAITLAAGASAQGLKISPEGGRFTLTFPGTEQPKETTETTDKGNAASPFTTHLFMQNNAGLGVFLAGWVDYNPTYKFTPKAEMEANRDNFLKGMNITLRSQSDIKLGTYDGIEFTGDGKDGLFVRSRVYIVGPRPYMLIAVSKNAGATGAIEAFLNSFQIK